MHAFPQAKIGETVVCRCGLVTSTRIDQWTHAITLRIVDKPTSSG